jgi:hypothetical protein
MIGRRPIDQHHCTLCAGLFPQRERLWWPRTVSLMASLLSPASALWASAGFARWRRDVVPARSRGVFTCLSASVGDPPRRGLHPKYGRRQPAAPNTKAGRIRSRRGCCGCCAGRAAPPSRRRGRHEQVALIASLRRCDWRGGGLGMGDRRPALCLVVRFARGVSRAGRRSDRITPAFG